MQPENPLKDLQEKEIANALDIEATPSSDKGEKSPDVSGIFMRKGEDLKRVREEQKRFIEQTEKEEAALKETQITDLRTKISGKKQIEITGEAAKKWQEYLETTKDLQSSRQASRDNPPTQQAA